MVRLPESCCAQEQRGPVVQRHPSVRPLRARPRCCGIDCGCISPRVHSWVHRGSRSSTLLPVCNLVGTLLRTSLSHVCLRSLHKAHCSGAFPRDLRTMPFTLPEICNSHSAETLGSISHAVIPTPGNVFLLTTDEDLPSRSSDRSVLG